jgi:hypothetical protein
MKLVSNARQGWKWLSTWAFTTLAALPFVWAELPADLKAMIPETAAPYLVTAVAIGGLIGRFVDQGGRT